MLFIILTNSKQNIYHLVKDGENMLPQDKEILFIYKEIKCKAHLNMGECQKQYSEWYQTALIPILYGSWLYSCKIPEK